MNFHNASKFGRLRRHRGDFEAANQFSTVLHAGGNFLCVARGIFRARSFGTCTWARGDDGAYGTSREGFHRQAGIEGGRK